MKFNARFPRKVLVLAIIFILHFSCSEDYDTLSEFVLADTKRAVHDQMVIDDTFIFTQGDTLVLDVLSNDLFEGFDNVKITETSNPAHGEILIVENRYIKYIPDNETSELESNVTEEAIFEEDNSSSEVEQDDAAEEGTPTVDEVISVPENVEEETAMEEENPTENEIITIPENVEQDAPTEEEIPAEEEVIVVSENTEDEEEVTAPSEGTTDTFTYTVEAENEDETVSTEEGTVTVVIAPEEDSVGCETRSGLAGERGLKTWCWQDIDLPSYSGNTGVGFSDNSLSFATECDENSVYKNGDQLVFALNPTTPATGSWCGRDYNMRAEIRTAPWPIKHALGTEEWFGWSYTFGNDYVIDPASEWLFHQVHNGVVGQTPLYELMVARTGIYDATAGEIIVKNNANSHDRELTGIIPVAGQTIDVVVHVIWGDASNGLLQVWIDGAKVYDKQVTTVRSGWNYGGNAKWGIYKWTWSGSSGVNASAAAGVTHLPTSMGALRIITRRPGDADYGQDSYSTVAPQ